MTPLTLVLRPALAFLNHLLRSEAWARQRLSPFAHQTLRFELIESGAFSASMRIEEDGTLSERPASGRGSEGEGGADEIADDVCIHLPASALLKLPVSPASLLSEARINGSAELAETLSFVFRNLRWDVESDLAAIVGDVIAYRAVRTARQGAEVLASVSQRLTANLSEAATEEWKWLVSPHQALAFSSDVDALRDDLARLESRIQRLSMRRQPG